MNTPDNDRLNRIRAQVNAGTYRPDADAIAQSMLTPRAEREAWQAWQAWAGAQVAAFIDAPHTEAEGEAVNNPVTATGEAKPLTVGKVLWWVIILAIFGAFGGQYVWQWWGLR